MNYSGVTYWARSAKAKPRRMDDICFHRLRGMSPWPESIRYVCPVNKELEMEQVQFFLKALATMMQADKYKTKVGVIKKPDWMSEGHGPIRIVYVLDTRGMTHIQALLHLTAFRYPAEFSGIVKRMWERRAELEGKDALTPFSLLHAVHADAAAGKCSRGLMTCHSLINTYNLRPLIAFDKFIARLTKGGADSVFESFA